MPRCVLIRQTVCCCSHLQCLVVSIMLLSQEGEEFDFDVAGSKVRFHEKTCINCNTEKVLNAALTFSFS